MENTRNKAKKTVRIFIDESGDEKRVFENIRMALGITLRGHKVILCLSEKARRVIDRMDKDMKKEVEEFLDSIPLMGGEVHYHEFENFLEGDGDFDFFIV